MGLTILGCHRNFSLSRAFGSLVARFVGVAMGGRAAQPRRARVGAAGRGRSARGAVVRAGALARHVPRRVRTEPRVDRQGQAR